MIVESFDGRPSSELQGMSVSVYDDEAALWRQTWVDGEGRFLVFAGRFADGAMELVTDRAPFLRMRWHDISEHALTWTLDRSSDGAAWERAWRIAYRRVV